MSKRQRRSYSDEYKRQAVDLVLSSGRSTKSVSKELGLDGSVLSRWVKEQGTVAAGGSAAARAAAGQHMVRRREEMFAIFHHHRCA